MKYPLSLLLVCLLLGFSAVSLAQENTLPEIEVIEAEVVALLPGLEELGVALTNTSDAAEKRLLAAQIVTLTQPIQQDFKAVYAEYDENDRIYREKMGTWTVFVPYGFGYNYLVEALQAQQANSKIKVSPYRAQLREIHELASTLSSPLKPKRQQRLEKTLVQQIEKIAKLEATATSASL
jgi:hypothetical protein